MTDIAAEPTAADDHVVGDGETPLRDTQSVDTESVDTELVDTELLVEEISIDGMCGVY